MNLSERRANLVKEINSISDEQTLAMMEAALGYYSHHNSKNITDELDPYQLQELTSLINEPADKNTISEDEFKKLFARANC